MVGRPRPRAFKEGHSIAHYGILHHILSVIKSGQTYDTSPSLKSKMEKDKQSKKHSTTSQVIAPPVLEKVEAEQLERSGKRKKIKCNVSKATWIKVLTVVYGILDVLTALKSICVIVLSIFAALAAKAFAKEQSGRIAALIVVCVTAAAVLSMCIYSMIAVFTKKNKPILYTSIVLIVLAVIQLVIASSTLVVSVNDKENLDKGLIDSFRLALEQDSRQHKLWSTIQSGLQCCGLNSPEDYRLLNNVNYFLPEVPISCCPSYDPVRSEILQEKEREWCKSRREYYKSGCKQLLETDLFNSAAVELHVVIGFIILEVVLSVLGIAVAKLRKKNKDEHDDDV